MVEVGLRMLSPAPAWWYVAVVPWHTVLSCACDREAPGCSDGGGGVLVCHLRQWCYVSRLTLCQLQGAGD